MIVCKGEGCDLKERCLRYKRLAEEMWHYNGPIPGEDKPCKNFIAKEEKTEP